MLDNTFRINTKALTFVVLSLLDALATDYFLSLGGEEVNPIFDHFLQQDWSVWQTKMLFLSGFAIVWTQLRKLDERSAEICIDFALIVMRVLIIYEIIGMVYIWV
tara:strand:- start:3509 stop:3823 length:315 start_codon:yes stop_codon:yes gene_type:complete